MKILKSVFLSEIIISLSIIIFSMGSLHAQQKTRGMKPTRNFPILKYKDEGLGYQNNWAFIVGINDYNYYRDLKTAVTGAKAVAELLKSDFGFQADHVIELYDENASRDSLEYYLKNYFREKTNKEDCLLVYFGGHGVTLNEKIGYICPVDYKEDDYSTCISLRVLDEINELIVAKHLLYIFDSCFSGMALVRGALEEIPNSERDYYKHILGQKGRQALTAGEKDQVVLDRGPNDKYSLFTFFLLKGLKSDEVADNYGIIRASELGNYLRKEVTNHSSDKQNPIYDHFQGSDHGDFLLWREAELKKEFPNLTLLSFQNNLVSLYSMIDHYAKRGKDYFLFVFWASWCPPCHTLIEILNTESLPKNLKIITINLDLPSKNSDIQSARNFISSFNSSKFFHLFLRNNDQFSEIISLIEGESLPKSLIVTKEKSIIHIEPGYEGKKKYMNMVMEHVGE